MRPIAVQSVSLHRPKLAGCRLSGTFVLHQFVADLLTIVQATQAGALHGGDMHEYIRAALIRLNEPKPFLRIDHFAVPVAMKALSDKKPTKAHC